MASSENDHDDGNETREEESCFVALFKKRVNAVRRSNRALFTMANCNFTNCNFKV